MFKKENFSSVAILDLFHVIPMDFQLQKLISFDHCSNLKYLSINKICVAINKVFNTVTVNLHSIFLFFSDIFGSLLIIFKNGMIMIKLWGGGEVNHCLNL